MFVTIVPPDSRNSICFGCLISPSRASPVSAFCRFACGTFLAFGIDFCHAVRIFVIFQALAYGNEVPGYASLMVVVLFLGGLQLIGIGFLENISGGLL